MTSGEIMNRYLAISQKGNHNYLLLVSLLLTAGILLILLIVHEAFISGNIPDMPDTIQTVKEELITTAVVHEKPRSEPFFLPRAGQRKKQSGMQQLRPSIETAPLETEEEKQEKNKPPYTPEEIYQQYSYDEAIKDVMHLMAQIDVAPDKNAGETTGVVITRIQADSLFERIGLEVNDTILSIDEKKIESVDDSLELYETLRTSKQGRILVKRDNQLERLTYYSE